MTKQVKKVAKSSTSKSAIVKATNNNKSTDKADDNNTNEAPASISSEANLVWLFEKKAWVAMDQLTAELVGADYKPQVTARLPKGETAPFMKATHEQIGEIVMSIPGNGKDVTIKRITAVYEMPEVEADDEAVFDTPLASKFAHNPDAKDAYDFGAQFDPTTISHLVKIVDGRKVYEGGWATVSADWERQFCVVDPTTNKVTFDPCWKMPRAGSGTKRNPVRGNEPPDYYKIETPDGSVIRGSVMDDMVMGCELGKPFITWKDVKKRASANSWQTSPVDAKLVREIIVDPKLTNHVNAALNDHDDKSWTTLDKAMNRDRNSLVSRVRQAIGFRQQRKAINDLPCVKVIMRGEQDGAAQVLTTPIQLNYLKPGEELPVASKPLTITQFLKINVPQAKQEAELEAKNTNKDVPISNALLLGTLKKGTGKRDEEKNKEKEKPAVKAKINNYKEFRDGIDSITAYSLESGSFESIQTALNKNDEESKLLATSLGPLADFIIRLEPFFRVRYQLAVATTSQQQEIEAREKLNAIASGDNSAVKQKAKGK